MLPRPDRPFGCRQRGPRCRHGRGPASSADRTPRSQSSGANAYLRGSQPRLRHQYAERRQQRERHQQRADLQELPAPSRPRLRGGSRSARGWSRAIRSPTGSGRGRCRSRSRCGSRPAAAPRRRPSRRSARPAGCSAGCRRTRRAMPARHAVPAVEPAAASRMPSLSGLYDARPRQPFDQHEQTGDERQHAPGRCAAAPATATRACATQTAAATSALAAKVGSPSGSASADADSSAAATNSDAEARRCGRSRRVRPVRVSMCDRAGQRLAAEPAQAEVGDGDRRERRQRELLQPLRRAAASGRRRRRDSPGSRSAARSSRRWR